jgi:hypothetical protein
MRFVVGKHGLEPCEDEAREFLESQIEGEPIDVDVGYPRDMVNHRRIMAQIGDLAKVLHLPVERLRAELLIKTGNFYLLDFDFLGKPVIAVNSMSRHHMRDHELHAFWDEAKEVISTEYLPRITDSAERDHWADQLSLPSRDDQRSVRPARSETSAP